MATIKTDEETIKKLRKAYPKVLDLKDCKSELEITREEYAKLSNFCMNLVDEKYNLKYELEKKEKDLDDLMQLMQEVQEANKKVQEINIKLCKNLKAANRDFFIAAALLFICTVALAFNI